jgi:hypothetical protein
MGLGALIVAAAHINSPTFAEALAPPNLRVGEVFVVGNERTPQTVILRQVPIYPGQILRPRVLRSGERNLARLTWLFLVDKENRPQVRVIDPHAKTAFRDVLISVSERPAASALWRSLDICEKFVPPQVSATLFLVGKCLDWPQEGWCSRIGADVIEFLQTREVDLEALFGDLQP